MSIKSVLSSRVGNLTVNILVIAVWFGLVTGLVEGTLFLALQQFGRSRQVSIEIIWVSACFNLILFGAVGLVLALIHLYLWRVRLWFVVCLFAFLAFLDWLGVTLGEWIYRAALLLLATGLAASVCRWFREHEIIAVRFWRVSLPYLMGLLVLAAFAIEAGLWLRERLETAHLTRATKNSPNVLVLVLDALRADHLSTYGYSRPTSPNIDRLAREGVLFEHAFATSPWTLPSHASLLTGRFPSQHGVGWQNPRGLNDSRDPTLGEALMARGYLTAGFSANVFWFTRDRGFDRGFVHFEDYFSSLPDRLSRPFYGRLIERFVLCRLGYEDIPARKHASDMNRAVLRWIDRDHEEPFFVFVNFMDTHDPYLPPRPFRNRYSRKNDPGGIINWRVGRSRPALSPEQLQDEIDAYDGAISYVDDAVGRLIESLRRRGLGTNTIVVLTSDHGESFGERGVYLHANSLYLNEIHVPLIFWSPGRIPAAQRIANPVTNAAVPATIMDLIDSDHKDLFPSPSLAKFWASAETQDCPYAIAETEQIKWLTRNSPSHHGWMKTLVSNQWQYIEHEKWGAELYDWRNDPHTLHNLAQGVDMQDVARFQLELRRLLDQISSEMCQVSAEGGAPEAPRK